MGFFDIFKTGESSKSSRRSPKKKKGLSSRKSTGQSSSKKRSWPAKSTRPRTTDTLTSAPSKKLTKTQTSAANKKAWAAKTAREKASYAAAKSTKQTAKTSTDPASKTPPERTRPTINGSPATGKKTTQAEPSVINKEKHRKQQELKRKAAATKQGSTRRRTFFKTQRDYKEYLGSEKWKKKRDEVRDQSQGKCEICGKGGSAVHHLRYTEPGSEHRSHLAFVCNSCHRRMHGTHG